MAMLVAAHIIDLVGNLAWVFALLVALELVASRVPVSWTSRLRAAAMWSTYILLTAVLLGLVDAVMHALHFRPLFSALPIDGVWGTLATGLTAVVLADFCRYWCHRAQHRWFWRSHAVHHSLRELSAVNSYVHWTENLFRIPLVAVPTALLTPAGEQLALVGGLVMLQNYFTHSPVRLSLGGLRRVFVDNHYHRIHHSLEPRHFGKNFAATLPLWDVLFGTAYFPRPNEWPATGLADIAEPNSLKEYLLAGLTTPGRPVGTQPV